MMAILGLTLLLIAMASVSSPFMNNSAETLFSLYWRSSKSNVSLCLCYSCFVRHTSFDNHHHADFSENTVFRLSS